MVEEIEADTYRIKSWVVPDRTRRYAAQIDMGSLS